MILLAILSFILTAVLMPFVRQKALNAGFLDRPDFRKRHDTPVPPVGGLVIIPVFVGLSYFAGLDMSANFYFLMALALVWIVGALDDLFHVPALTKFGLHMIAATILVLGNDTIVYYLGDLFGFGEIWTEPLAIVFSMLCVVFLINAVNMIDGLDGLSSGILLIMLMALSCAAQIVGGHELLPVMMVLMGAVCGFMLYNYRHFFRDKACVFMGDSGSTSLGVIMAWLVIELSQDTLQMKPGLLHPALIAWILSLPVFDTLSLFIYRMIQKRSPFSPDRRHLHYLVCDRGLSIERTVNLMQAMTLFYAAVGVVGILVFHISIPILMSLWVALFWLHFSVTFGAAQWVLRKVMNSY